MAVDRVHLIEFWFQLFARVAIYTVSVYIHHHVLLVKLKPDNHVIFPPISVSLAWRRVTLLIETNVLPLPVCQTFHFWSCKFI